MTTKKKVGRKSKYYLIREKLEKIRDMAKHGYIDSEIYEYIGVSSATYYKFMSENPEISESIKREKVTANIEIENSMYKRATGIEYIEETLEYIPGGADGKTTVKVVKKTKKYEPPNVMAGKFLLMNRRPTKYKDRQEIDLKVVDKDQAKKEIEEMFE